MVTTQKMNDSLQNSSVSIKSDYMLSFLLYVIEKDFHFSGNGVWNTQNEIKKMSTQDSSKALLMDTEELDHDPSTKLL